MTSHNEAINAPTLNSTDAGFGVARLFDLGLALAISLPYIVFGLNKFLLFANVAPPADPTAQMFLGAMFTSYLATVVGIAEIVGGVLYLFARTRFVGLLILMPVVANIVAFHVAHDMPGNMIWLFTTALFGVAMFKHRAVLARLVAPARESAA
ncbi:MAG: hypothetical protein AAGC55_08035 [Myxococcota bacterium]